MTPLPPTILTPYGYSGGTCGYCSPSGERSKGRSSRKYGMLAQQMTPQFYQILVDRGWRRSGDYVYHPDMARTCCPQYTIRLNCPNFKVSKKQRQVVNRFNRYLETGQKPGEKAPQLAKAGSGDANAMHDKGFDVAHDEEKGKAGARGKGKGKGKNNQPSDVFADLHALEVGFGREAGAAHKFETQLIPAKATPETFELYKAYQVSVHKDKPEETTIGGFSGFLCGETLVGTPIDYSEDVSEELKTGRLPKTYGQYHLLYRLDSQLVGISVIDILPKCVSSVYFIWHPDWAWASLGKLSAVYEVSLVRRMRDKGTREMEWAYMGYWIPDCQKMRYKSEYSPSELLDPGTNVFYPLTTSLETFLSAHPKGYHPFSGIVNVTNGDDGQASKCTKDESEDLSPGLRQTSTTNEDEDEDEEEEGVMGSWPSPPPPSFLDPKTISNRDVEKIVLLLGKGRGRTIIPVGRLEFGDPKSTYREIKEFISALGLEHVAKLGEMGDRGERAMLYYG